MKAHIVHAHPEGGSFTAAMRDVVVEGLGAHGYEVSVSDLYAMNFNPLISKKDFMHPVEVPVAFTKEQRRGWKDRTLSDDIMEEVERVLAADLLVLTFPIYWFSMPAMMKGWVDRVLLAGPFYSGRDMYDRGGMAGKKALVVASLGGREHMFGLDSLHGPMADGMLRHIFQGTLGVVGYDVVAPFLAYHAPYVDEEARAIMLVQLREHVADLDRLPILPMPSLSGFDNRFRPLAASSSSDQDSSFT